MKKNKALFVSHEDDNSGAPKALYNVLKFILINYELNLDIFVCDTKFVGVFENLKKGLNDRNIPNVFYQKKSTQNRIIRKVKGFINRKLFAKSRIEKYNKKYDFIFFNSISYNYFKLELEGITIPKYLYLHEGTNFLFNSLKDDYSIFNNFQIIFVPSKQVEADLTAHGICKSKITVLQLFLDDDEIIEESSVLSNSNKGELVVGNLANLNEMKGVEYFLATAKLYKEMYPNDTIKFKWKGYTKDSFLHNLTNYEIQNAGLNNVVLLEEKSKDIKSFFSTIDVLMMTSKQETFGFVVLEAANHFTPSIAFKEVVGASEFINKYGGFTVEYLSINQLVVCLKEYYENRDLIRLHGINANRHLKANYTLNEKLKKDFKSKLEFMMN